MPKHRRQEPPAGETPGAVSLWGRRVGLAVLVLGGLVVGGWLARGDIGEPPSAGLSIERLETPDQTDGGPVLAGQEVPLPEPGEVEVAWLEARDGLPVPIFVVRDPADDVHTVRAATAYLADVEASVGWCEDGAVFLSWWLGAVFAPDGSYLGGPPARGLDTFDSELTDRGTVCIGAMRQGLSREASQSHTDEQQQRWGRLDHDVCFNAGSPLAALALHGVPAGDVHDSAIAPSEVALDGPERPDGWVLLDGTLVAGEASRQPPLLCDELISTDPPACPDDASRVRMQPLRDDVVAWAYTGLFRAAVQGSQLGHLTLVTADVFRPSGPEEIPPVDPPLQ